MTMSFDMRMVSSRQAEGEDRPVAIETAEESYRSNISNVDSE